MLGLSTLLLYGWAYVMLSRKLESGLMITKSSALIFAGLFWLLAFASVFWSDVKPASLLGFTVFTAMPLTFFTGAFSADEVYFKKVGYCLAVIFGALAVWAMFQFCFMNKYFFGQARHPLADPSSLGSLFSLALFCALGWLLAPRPAGEHRCAVILSALLVCGIIATVARGPVFAFIPGAVILCIALWPRIKANARSLLIVAVCASIFYGLTLLGVQKHFDLAERVYGTISMKGDITNNRLQIWATTWEMIKHHPLLGTGIGTFYLNYPQYRQETDISGAFLAHNDPLQFWAELGVLGPLLFYAFCFAALFRSCKALRTLKEEKDVSSRIIVASLFAGLASMVVGSHVGFNHYNLCILMMNGLLLSVWFVFSGRALKETAVSASLPNASPGLNRVLLGLPFVMMLWLMLSIVAGEHYANRARDNLFKEEMSCITPTVSGGMTTNCFMENINRADHVSHGLNYRVYIFAVNVPITILEYQKGKMTDEQASTLYHQVVDYMQRALAINPHAGDAYYYLGLVQTLVPSSIIPPSTPTAEEYYKKALANDPMLVGARLSLLDLYKAVGRSRDDQIAVMEPGENFYYTTPVASSYYDALARLYLENKNYVKMNEMLVKMHRFQRRSDFSKVRQETSIPEAIMGGDSVFVKPR